MLVDYLRVAENIDNTREYDIPEDLWHLSSLQFAHEITCYVADKLQLPFTRSRHPEAFILPPTPDKRRRWIDTFLDKDCEFYQDTMVELLVDIGKGLYKETFNRLARVIRRNASQYVYTKYCFRQTLMHLVLLGLVAHEMGYDWGLRFAMEQMRICTDKLLSTDLQNNETVNYLLKSEE